MNLIDALCSHISWKLRLQKVIDGTSEEQLDAATVARDDACELGKWIYGEGLKYKASETYRALGRVHANFHICAAKVVLKAQEGDKRSAASLLHTTIEPLSREIVRVMSDLRDEDVKGEL